MTEPYLLQAACIYNILQYNRTLMAWSLAGSQVLQGQNMNTLASFYASVRRFSDLCKIHDHKIYACTVYTCI
jgi:hypothetical protein